MSNPSLEKYLAEVEVKKGDTSNNGAIYFQKRRIAYEERIKQVELEKKRKESEYQRKYYQNNLEKLKENKKKSYENNKSKIIPYTEKDYKLAINHQYYTYKNTAKTKKHSFELSKDEFEKLILGSCHYCGMKPSKPLIKRDAVIIANTFRNGIDRMDNTRGYEKDNVVTCCERDNYFKGPMPYSKFMDWIKQIRKNKEE